MRRFRMRSIELKDSGEGYSLFHHALLLHFLSFTGQIIFQHDNIFLNEALNAVLPFDNLM